MKTRLVAMLVVMVAVFGAFTFVNAVSPNDPQAACDSAVARAFAIDPTSDTVASVDGAIARCASLEVWVKSAQRYPDAFGGTDPAGLARARCAASADLAGTTICTAIGGTKGS